MRTIPRLLLFMVVLLASLSPALAQEATPARIALGAFSFVPDPALGMHVNLVQMTGEEMIMPPQAPHTEFMLYRELPAPFNFNDAVATIYVYPVEKMAGMPDHAERLAALQALLETRSDLEPYMAAVETERTLPFLPIFPAGQVLRARARTVETPAVSGISFITAYAQAREPFLADQFLYTFQGLSADGRYYVSVLLPLDTALFPAEPDPNFGPLELEADVAGYMQASVAALNAAAPGDFTPALDSLDALVDSFAFAE